jgi:recombinase-like zinc beta ribbon protein
VVVRPRALDRTRATYLRGTRGRLWSRPESGLEAGAPGLPKYLLTGFLECVVCHGGMHATKRTSQRGAPAFYYVCREHRVRGDYLCTNSLSAPMADLHGDLIAKLRGDVLQPDVLEAVLERALELERAPEAPDRRAALGDELSRLDREIARYTDAIAHGGSLPSILAALHERERRRQELQAQLEHQDGLGLPVRAFDSKAVRRELRDLLTDWQGLLEGEPAQARQILRKLLEGRVVMHPHVNGRERTYEWIVTATYGRILSGVVGVTVMVPPG